jgi:hypothetical protein
MANPFDRFDTVQNPYSGFNSMQNPFDRFDAPQNPFDAFDDDEEEEGPGIGQVASGLLAEIAIAESLKYKAAKTGAKRGPYGAFQGYIAGGIGGGITGSIAAQKLEGRDDISWGRVVADSLINLIPGGLGKAKSGSKVIPRLAKGAAIRGTEGAVIATLGGQVEKGIEEGERLTLDEVSTLAGTGFGLGLGLGVAGEVLKKSYSKFAGKSDSFLNKAYNDGDPEATAFVESVAGENPTGRGMRYLKMLGAKLSPATTLGRQVNEETNSAISKARARLDTASTVRDQINKQTKDFTQDQRDQLDDYIFNKTSDIIPEAQGLKPILVEARELINEYQNTIYNLYKEGRIDLNDYVAAKINKSIKSKDYFTREYRFYEDPSYTPSPEVTNKLKSRLSKDGMDDESINVFIRGLDEHKKRQDTVGLMNHIAGASSGSTKVFKKRKLDESPELREYLGEYTEAGERMFGTISRLGKIAAQEESNKSITEQIVKNNLGRVVNSASEDTGDLVPLSIRGKQQTVGDSLVVRNEKVNKYQAPDGNRFDTIKEATDAGYKKQQLKKINRQAIKVRQPGQSVYVPEEVNEALNQYFATGSQRDGTSMVESVLGKVLSTTTAGAKFVRVPLNAASYPVQFIGNGVMVAGQGMNPFNGWKRGFGIALNEINNKGIAKGKYSLKEINRLKELDLIDQGVVAGDIRDGFKNGVLPKAFSKVTDFFGKAYNVFDTAQRISVFENYKGFLKNNIPKEQFNKLTTKQKEDMAAFLTNSTYQNYGRINKNLRSMSRYGILNEFAAFNIEQTRTLYNQGRMAKSMLDGSFSDEMEKAYGVTLNKDAMRGEGLKRVAALSGVLTLGSAGVSQLNKMGGVDDDDEKFLRDFGLAKWEEDQSLHIRRDGNKLSLANMSYQIPSAELTSIVEAGLRGDDFESAAGNIVDSAWGKFGGDLTINLKNIVSAVTNTDLRTGKELVNEPDGMRKNLGLVKYYFAENFTPGTVRDLQSLDKRTSVENTLRYTLGYRSRNTTIDEGIGYKLRDLESSLTNIRSSYSGDTKKMDSVEDAYNKNNAVYLRNMEVLVDFASQAKDFGARNPDSGLTDEKIDSLMQKAGFNKTQRDGAMSGVITDMPIFVASGARKKEDKINRYIELGLKMSPQTLTTMLQRDFDDKKIKRADVRRIMIGVEANKVFGQ